MDILIRKRYKVVQTVREEDGFALLEAVDIVDRETPNRLINRYEGEPVHRYARIYALMQTTDCPAFHEVFFENNRLFAVFDTSTGAPIENVFHKGDTWTWRDRLDYAELLLHQALLLSNLPPEIGIAALQPDNVRVDTAEKRVSLRYMIRPVTVSENASPAAQAAGRVRTILVPKLTSGKAEIGLIRRLDEGGFKSLAALYGCFKDAKPKIEEERSQFENMNFVQKGLLILGRVFLRRTKWGDRL